MKKERRRERNRRGEGRGRGCGRGSGSWERTFKSIKVTIVSKWNIRAVKEIEQAAIAMRGEQREGRG